METYGYLDYVTYADYLNALKAKGEIDEDTRSKAVAFGRTKDQDSELVSEYVKEFTAYYKAKGYTVRRYDAIMMGKKNMPTADSSSCLHTGYSACNASGKYFSGLIDIDSIHDAAKVEGKRGLHLPYTIRYMGKEIFTGHHGKWHNTQVPDVL